jgi:micrococcal nuclease
MATSTTSTTTTVGVSTTRPYPSSPSSTSALPTTGTTRASSAAGGTSTTVLSPVLPPGDDTTVERIIDGDTVVVAGGERVRFIGVDTPEVNQDACFAAEATAFTRSLIPVGTGVRLVYDVERTDRYGRTLAYIYRTADGLFVNAQLVSEGFAQILTIPPNVAHAEEFLAAERRARDGGLGLWGGCAATSTTASNTNATNCDPSYPDVCIPPPPPDLDCGDIPYRRFRVIGSDPHRFDGDHDGVGCER